MFPASPHGQTDKTTCLRRGIRRLRHVGSVQFTLEPLEPGAWIFFLYLSPSPMWFGKPYGRVSISELRDVGVAP